MFNEDDLLPLSGLQHLVFCDRQWGLIHIEQVWAENRLTAQGRVLHERAHEGGGESRPGLRIARGLRLRSLRLGLSGQADVVEFRPAAEGVALDGEEGWWRPFPVEYKRGRPKPDRCDEVQLCAQALCLEEMFGHPVEAGALFYGTPRRRLEVPFDAGLRGETERLAARMHELYRAGATPRAVYAPKCDNCSLIALCMPRALGKPPGVARYLARALAAGDE
ncbi:MAG: CRISPR-associated protein Cas4 [Bryobacteraceae bacterium]